MTRELFDELIGPPPLSTVDVERIMAAQDRSRRRRRWLVTCGAAIGVAAVLAAGALRPGLPAGPASQHASPVVLTQYRDFTAWLDREVPAAVPALRWRGEGSRAYSAHDGEDPAGFSYRRPFEAGGWSGEVEVYIVTPGSSDAGAQAMCDDFGSRDGCLVPPSGVPGVECVVVGGLEIVCARDGLVVRPELRITGRDLKTPLPFGIGVLVPVVARLATVLPPAPR
ncbi:hypothetical protein [Dactylosporangium sp. CA-139066]|uniref:hypothetical protein n=1 Tax=Dactylosporangium sp. CA-139066 TaxID=3239930 RepID=UPI003D900AE4